MNKIRARLAQTSESMIASIILVLNLVKIAGQTLFCLSFSAIVKAFYMMFLWLQPISLATAINTPALAPFNHQKFKYYR